MRLWIVAVAMLGFIAVAGDWLLAANTVTNKGNASTPAPQPARPASGPAPQSPLPSGGGGSGLRSVPPLPAGSVPVHSQRKAKPSNTAPAPSASGNSASSTAKLSATSTLSTASQARSTPGYYGSNYAGYYSGYGYPYGTTPYVLGYYPNGATYLYPLYSGYGYGYGGYYGSGVYPGYGYYQSRYYYPPYVFADASQLFGPVAVLRMMGVYQYNDPNVANVNPGGGPWAAGGAANNGNGLNNGGNNAQANALANAAGNNVPAVDAEAKKADRPSAGRAAAVAWKFIGYGDGYFAKQKYNDAFERYRTASRQTATIADAWFRQGFALAALGKYELSAKAFRHGLEINADWATADFHLTEIYGDNEDEKKSKLDAMLAAADRQPTDADIAFVVGVHLYFDGQTDKAAPYFRKAAQVVGSDADVKGFLAAK